MDGDLLWFELTIAFAISIVLTFLIVNFFAICVIGPILLASGTINLVIAEGQTDSTISILGYLSLAFGIIFISPGLVYAAVAVLILLLIALGTIAATIFSIYNVF